jgi:hypothetical protein
MCNFQGLFVASVLLQDDLELIRRNLIFAVSDGLDTIPP